MIPEHSFGPRLSKSRYISGRQCHLRLWFDCFSPYLAREPAGRHNLAVRTGRAVGALATELFTSGRFVHADREHHDAAVAETEALMADPGVTTLFEAAFVHQGVRVRVDALARAGDGRWDVTEVKSGLELRPIHVDALGLQTWVLRGAGVEVGRAEVMTLNRSYRRQGALELEHLFVRHDCTEDARARAESVAHEIDAFATMLSGATPPVVRPGAHCWSPFPCPYLDHCLAEAGDHPLSELPGLSAQRRAELADRGICDVAGLPASEPLSALQARVRHCVRSKRAFVSDLLAERLAELRPPLHHLTLGILRPAIPRFSGMRPYQRLPYVYSDRIGEHGDGRRDYLCAECRDPREELAAAVIAATVDAGSICTYGSVAVRVLAELAAHLPAMAEALEFVSAPLVDLQALVVAHYYHPDLRGSFAVERVAAVLGLSPWHQESRLRDEYAAGVTYERSLAATADERAESHARVLRYFGRCASGLVALRRSLTERA